jgi:hypothetical protein
VNKNQLSVQVDNNADLKSLKGSKKNLKQGPKHLFKIGSGAISEDTDKNELSFEKELYSKKTEFQRQLEALKNPEKMAITVKEMMEFKKVFELTTNHMTKVIWLDNESDSFKREDRVPFGSSPDAQADRVWNRRRRDLIAR